MSAMQTTDGRILGGELSYNDFMFLLWCQLALVQYRVGTGTRYNYLSVGLDWHAFAARAKSAQPAAQNRLGAQRPVSK